MTGLGRLRKRDVEALLDGYDADPIGALTAALRIVLDRPAATWGELLDAAPLTADRRAALAAVDQRAMDALAAELNELRTLDADRR